MLKSVPKVPQHGASSFYFTVKVMQTKSFHSALKSTTQTHTINPQNSCGWNGLLEVTLSMPPAQAGQPGTGCQGPCPDRSEYLQGWRLHNLPGQPVPVLGHPHSEKAFPDVHREPLVFQFVPIACWPVTGHHLAQSSLHPPSRYL